MQVWQYDCCDNDEEATLLCLLPPPHQCNLAWRCFSSLVEDAACMARSSSTSCPLPTSAISHRAVSPPLCKLLHAWHVLFYRIIVLSTSSALSIALVSTSAVVLFLLLIECTLCGVFLVTPCPSRCFPSRHQCQWSTCSLLLPHHRSLTSLLAGVLYFDKLTRHCLLDQMNHKDDGSRDIRGTKMLTHPERYYLLRVTGRVLDDDCPSA